VENIAEWNVAPSTPTKLARLKLAVDPENIAERKLALVKVVCWKSTPLENLADSKSTSPVLNCARPKLVSPEMEKAKPPLYRIICQFKVDQHEAYELQSTLIH
jgi:hypothetical protein